MSTILDDPTCRPQVPRMKCLRCGREETALARAQAFPDKPIPWGWVWSVDPETAGDAVICERCIATHASPQRPDNARVCGAYLGDNDGTSPQLTCIRRHGHEGAHDNVRGDDEPELTPCTECASAGLPPHMRTVRAVAAT